MFPLRRAPSRPGHRYFHGSPLLVAHRGGSALAPESTLFAFRRALDWWRADLLEIDVHPTRDGEVVVIHDDTVDRTSDGRGAVASKTLAELKALDFGYRFTPDGGKTFPFRGWRIGISTLAEVLEALPNARVNVEIKDGRAQERVWETVHAAGATERVLIAAARLANRSRFASYAGPTSASAEELRTFYSLHRLHATRFYRPTTDAFQMPERWGRLQLLSPRFVREAHAFGIQVHVWTVDDARDMRRLLEWGADGVITDRPDRLARVLHASHGRPLPPGPAADAEPFLEWLLRD